MCAIMMMIIIITSSSSSLSSDGPRPPQDPRQVQNIMWRSYISLTPGQALRIHWFVLTWFCTSHRFENLRHAGHVFKTSLYYYWLETSPVANIIVSLKTHKWWLPRTSQDRLKRGQDDPNMTLIFLIDDSWVLMKMIRHAYHIYVWLMTHKVIHYVPDSLFILLMLH